MGCQDINDDNDNGKRRNIFNPDQQAQVNKVAPFMDDGPVDLNPFPSEEVLRSDIDNN